MGRLGLIGRIAVQQGMISGDQLQRAIREQGRRPDMRLGEVLVELGYIDEGQLGALLAAQARAGERVTQSKRPTPSPIKKPVPDGVTLGAIALKRVSAAEFADKTDKTNKTNKTDKRVDNEAERKEGAEARGWLLGVLADAVTTGASDVLMIPDQPVRLSRFGRLHDFTTGPVSAAGMQRLLLPTLNPVQTLELEKQGHVTVMFEAPTVGRFRLQVHRELGGVGGTFHRTQHGTPPGLGELGLPNWLAALTNFSHGMLLVTGPTGSGRSTTMSALIHLIAEERSSHVVVVETPREHQSVGGEALITQLEVGVHCASVKEAIHDAPRMDADILCIDELPTDAVDAALRAADTDQLVIATLRSPSSPRALEMLVDSYPTTERRAATALVADSVKAVLAQRLVPAASREGGEETGFALALEVVQVDERIRELIRSDQLGQISAHVQSGRPQGCIMLDTALSELVRKGRITLEAARANARNPAHFTQRERGA